MEKVLIVSQIIVALLMSITILIQEKGDGFGEALGGASGAAGFQTQKRGAEKVLHNLTVVLVTLFLILSFTINLV